MRAMRILFLAASVLMAGASPIAISQATVAQRLVGAWELVNSANKADASPATDDLRAAAYRRYLGYYGPFVVDEGKGIVTHIVDGSSNPSWVGSRQVRYYALSPDNAQLTLMLKDTTGRVTQSLVWKRSRP